jgi:NTE family protein
MKIALALSGGGVRAAAHLGIVEVLRQNGFEVAALSGSSGGALVGALLADGYAPREVRAIIKEVKAWDLMERSKKGGMFGLGRIEKLLQANLKTETLEELPLPFTVAATDLAEGNIHYFDKGPVAQLCAASSSLIPFFSPVRYGNLLLADGGFMDNMPTRVLKVHDCPVIGVNVNPIHPKNPDNILKTTYRALVLMMAANVEASRQHADCYIEVAGCEAINIFDLKQVDAAFEAGLKEGETLAKKLKKRF